MVKSNSKSQQRQQKESGGSIKKSDDLEQSLNEAYNLPPNKVLLFAKLIVVCLTY
jgi:hypothetical protein